MRQTFFRHIVKLTLEANTEIDSLHLHMRQLCIAIIRSVITLRMMQFRMTGLKRYIVRDQTTCLAQYALTLSKFECSCVKEARANEVLILNFKYSLSLTDD